MEATGDFTFEHDKEESNRDAGLTRAIRWVRETNAALVDIDGLSGWQLLGLKLVLDWGEGEFQILFGDDVIFDSIENTDPFDERLAAEKLWEVLDREARNLNLQRRALRTHLEKRGWGPEENDGGVG